MKWELFNRFLRGAFYLTLENRVTEIPCELTMQLPSPEGNRPWWTRGRGLRGTYMTVQRYCRQTNCEDDMTG